MRGIRIPAGRAEEGYEDIPAVRMSLKKERHMRRFATPLAAIALLAAGGFAAVAIASGGGLAGVTTAGTLGTTSSTPRAKVTICHRTRSKTNPFVAITVAAPAVRAHLAHGDALGACTAATVIKMKRHGRGAGTGTTTTTTTQTTSSTNAPGNSDHGNSGNHGNGGGAGKGHP
jgi:hypothetical protein